MQLLQTGGLDLLSHRETKTIAGFGL